MTTVATTTHRHTTTVTTVRRDVQYRGARVCALDAGRVCALRRRALRRRCRRRHARTLGPRACAQSLPPPPPPPPNAVPALPYRRRRFRWPTVHDRSVATVAANRRPLLRGKSARRLSIFFPSATNAGHASTTRWRLCWSVCETRKKNSFRPNANYRVQYLYELGILAQIGREKGQPLKFWKITRGRPHRDNNQY